MAERCYKQPKNLHLEIVLYEIWGTQTPWELGCIASTPKARTSCKNTLDRLVPSQICSWFLFISQQTSNIYFWQTVSQAVGLLPQSKFTCGRPGFRSVEGTTLQQMGISAFLRAPFHIEQNPSTFAGVRASIQVSPPGPSLWTVWRLLPCSPSPPVTIKGIGIKTQPCGQSDWGRCLPFLQHGAEGTPVRCKSLHERGCSERVQSQQKKVKRKKRFCLSPAVLST